MDTTARVLPSAPVRDLGAAGESGFGRGLDAALELGPASIIEHLEASGLRGRGGAGFPTGTKWRTVAEHASAELPATVVVNAAEGEPGSFKDRSILRADPYRVLEGALIAAVAVDASAVAVATKGSFTREIARLRDAVEELDAAEIGTGIAIGIVEGPDDYLYGEETALLEVIAGRHPLPRVAPPYRAGLDERDPRSKSAADEVLAAPGAATPVPPTLVNNVETLANVPGILDRGPSWFRELGTPASPGTVVCTVSGATRRAGVAEVPTGTTLAAVIEGVGGGAEDGHELVAAVSGVANPVLPAEAFGTPLCYDAMRAAGSGLGAAGFLVFDERDDPAAIAAGVSRFLGVESCGQCTPCKEDGLDLAERFDRLRRSQASEIDLVEIDRRLARITDGARCYLAHQHQELGRSLTARFDTGLRRHLDGSPAALAVPIAAIADIADGEAVLDRAELHKQPDWTHGDEDSGRTPAERFAAEPER